MSIIAKDGTVTQITSGTAEGRFHSHSYYDIPVVSKDGSRCVLYQTTFTERMPEPKDVVRIGVADLAGQETDWIGESSAWSWQQGPMAQFLPSGDGIVWNDRGTDGFIARLYRNGETRPLSRSVYAVHPKKDFGLGLDMARLEALRPGYGYAVERRETLDLRPADNGIFRINFTTGAASLILSIKDAVAFLLGHLSWLEAAKLRFGGYAFWFNHAKFSPAGDRFTVKLRWRKPGKGWNDNQGVSLTLRPDGSDLRLLDRGTSHVIWEDDQTLFYWQGKNVVRTRDTAPRGQCLGTIAPEAMTTNVHVRKTSDGQFIFDTPYKEDVGLKLFDEKSGQVRELAVFGGHKPARGPYRCDLHPVPLTNEKGAAVTSLADGGRQLYKVTWDD